MSEQLNPSEEYADWKASETGEVVEENETVVKPDDSQEYDEAYDAIMILVKDLSLEDQQVIDLVTDLLQEQFDNQNRWFTHLINKLDPNSYSATTKRLNEQEKSRLRLAINRIG